MTELTDTREQITRSMPTATETPTDIAESLGELVSAVVWEYPDVSLPTIRLDVFDGTDGRKVCIITCRRGELAEPTDARHDAQVASALAGTRLAGPCPSCHQLPHRPPTDYCQTPERHDVQP